MSVELLKLHLNLDHNDDDQLLQHYYDAACGWITNYTGYAISQFKPEITQAALMLSAFWYTQREASSFDIKTGEVPYGVRDILSAHRRQVTGHEAYA